MSINYVQETVKGLLLERIRKGKITFIYAHVPRALHV